MADVYTENIYIPIHPEYMIERDRIKSFADWPPSLPLPNKKKLSRAGFFFTGKTNKISCYFCDGNFTNHSEESDDAWIEHARLNTDCHYLEVCKGKDFVKKVRNNEPIEEKSRKTSVSMNANCIECKTNVNNCCFLPCGHMVMCHECAMNISNVCPICNAEIKTKLKRYGC